MSFDISKAAVSIEDMLEGKKCDLKEKEGVLTIESKQGLPIKTASGEIYRYKGRYYNRVSCSGPGEGINRYRLTEKKEKKVKEVPEQKPEE